MKGMMNEGNNPAVELAHKRRRTAVVFNRDERKETTEPSPYLRHPHISFPTQPNANQERYHG